MDEGRKVTVRCVAFGATPAAEIYWNSEPEMDLSDVTEETKRFVTNMTLFGKDVPSFAYANLVNG